MSEAAIIAELRAALEVAMGENEGRIAMERLLKKERDQALAKVEGLNLAADQYSVSRDQWMLKAKAAEADAAALRRALSVLTNVGDAESARSIASKMLQRVNAGAALLVELDAARKVVEAARAAVGTDPAYNDIARLSFALKAALTAYDAALKGGEG